MKHLVRPLDELVHGTVDTVFELLLSGLVTAAKVVLSVRHAREVVAPLPKRPPKKREGSSALAPGDSGEEEAEEDGEEEEYAAALALELLEGIDSDSSGCSADTDVDDELGEGDIKKDAEGLKTRLSERIQELAARALEPAEPDPAPEPAPALEPEPGEFPRGPRAAAGTWNIWEGVWFYMTQTPGFTDLKMHMRGNFYS